MISLVFASRSAILTDATDLVTANNHGFSANNQIKFLTIVSTTGISTNTWYYVANNVSLTTNTFQLSATAGGTVLPLTTNGTGTIDIPISSVKTNYIAYYKYLIPKNIKLTKFSPVTLMNNVSLWKSTLLYKFSPVTLMNNVSLWKSTLLYKFSPVITTITSSAKTRLTNLISEFISFSPILQMIPSGVKTGLINYKTINFTNFAPLQILNTISYSLPKWANIDTIKSKFTFIPNLPVSISFILDMRFNTAKIFISPINTANAMNALVKISNIKSILRNFSFVKTMNVITRKLPNPRDSWSQVTQQIKTLIQFWS